jgi:hypothetical protein
MEVLRLFKEEILISIKSPLVMTASGIFIEVFSGISLNNILLLEQLTRDSNTNARII